MRVSLVVGTAVWLLAVSLGVSNAHKVRSEDSYTWKPMNNTGPSEEEAITKWLIGFKKGSFDEISELVSKVGGVITRKFRLIDGISVDLPLKVGSEDTNSKLISKLSSHESVEYVEKDQIRFPSSETMPYGVTQVQSTNVWYDGDNWSAGQYRSVCVIDSGLDRTHEEFSSAYITNQNSYSEWAYDGCNHGNHVSGTISATSFNGVGVYSVAPYASQYIVKVFHGSSCGWSYSGGLAAAAEDCYYGGANIISMSLGGSGYSSTENNMFYSLFYSYSMLVVAAAGNSGGGDYSYPASYSSVMSVAAVDSNKNRASFSTYNNQVEVSGPGVSVLSPVTGADGSSSYAYYSGTSMATPHVSGVAALIWARRPTLHAYYIRYCLQMTAQDLGSAGKDNYYGYGLVQAYGAHQCVLSI